MADEDHFLFILALCRLFCQQFSILYFDFFVYFVNQPEKRVYNRSHAGVEKQQFLTGKTFKSGLLYRVWFTNRGNKNPIQMAKTIKIGCALQGKGRRV